MTSFISTDVSLSEPQFRRAWKNTVDDAVAAVDFAPGITLYFRSAADARALAAACTEAAEALAAIENGRGA